jgi:hypothetical protein
MLLSIIWQSSKYVFVFYLLCLILNIFRFLFLGRVYRVCICKDTLKVTTLISYFTAAVCPAVIGKW